MADTHKRPGPIRSALMFVVFQLVTLVPVLNAMLIWRGISMRSYYAAIRPLSPEMEQQILSTYGESPEILAQISLHKGPFWETHYVVGFITSFILAGFAAWLLWRNNGGWRKSWLPLGTYVAFVLSASTWQIYYALEYNIQLAFFYALPVLSLALLVLFQFYRRHIWSAAFFLPALMFSIAIVERVWFVYWVLPHRI